MCIRDRVLLYLLSSCSGGSSAPAASTPPADTSAPSAPQNLNASANVESQIDLTWDASTDTGGSGLAGYRIYRDGGPTSIASTASTSYSDTGLIANTNYDYTVSAYDGAGNESAVSTNSAAITLPDTTAPTVPSNLSAVTITGSQIDLSWNASTDSGGSSLAGYRIYRDGNPMAIGTTANTNYSDTGLTADTSYSYAVTAYDSADNESAESSSAIAITQIPNVIVQRVFSQISFASPVALMQAPGDNSRWFAVTQSGIVYVFDNDQNVVQGDVDVFVDISGPVVSGGERGLLGMAFHPNYAANGQVFLSYTGGASPGTSFISRFSTDPATGYLDAGSEEIILNVPQDFGNHNGGNIAFGPDGFLYIGFGDGGSGGDPNERAQDTTYILGSMVRLDVDSASPYAIPPNNPFAGNTNCMNGSGTMPCPEIYAWGLRNPWRWSFDSQTGDLWVGDVGQGQWEEVNRVELGMNYGWDDREGAHCFEPSSGCLTNNVDPITEYDHSVGQSITGGYVYRGTVNASLQGYYVFGDYVSGRIWAVDATSPQGTSPTQIDNTNLNISSFAEGVDGELYAVDHGGGGIYQIVAAP